MRAWLCMTLALGVLLAAASPALADLGLLVADGVRGPYRISVLASPVPLRAGPSQWNVLVLDNEGASVEAARVELSFRRIGAEGNWIQSRAEGSRHPFYRSRVANLPVAAHWHGSVNVEGAEGSATLDFEVTAAPRLEPWWEYAPALLAPLLAIGLFALHQSLALQRRRADP